MLERNQCRRSGGLQAGDEDDREQSLSPLFLRAPCFRNALVQNIMGGNTMLMNRAAATLVAAAAVAKLPGKPCLAVVLVGDDPASQIYVKSKGEKTEAAGMRSITTRLPGSSSMNAP